MMIHEDEKKELTTTCKICRRVFKPEGMSKICPSCDIRDDSVYKDIKEYLYKHPGTSSEVLETLFGVKKETIVRYLKEYRLEITNPEVTYYLVCEVCHTPIRTGRFCEKCEPAAIRSERKGSSIYRQPLRDEKFRTPLKDSDTK